MYRINDRYLYSLNDLNLVPNTYEDAIPYFTMFADCFSTSFITREGFYWTSGLGKTLWEYVWHNYGNDICIIEDDDNGIPTSTNRKEFANNFYAKFKITKQYYETLINLYESQESHLMDQVESSIETLNKYNDTPQNGGDFDTDNHTTNSNKSTTTSKSDVDTIISRLTEVRRKLVDVYNLWAKEFDGLFISHLNYDKFGGYINEL